jgi:hypothetical protein
MLDQRSGPSHPARLCDVRINLQLQQLTTPIKELVVHTARIEQAQTALRAARLKYHLGQAIPVTAKDAGIGFGSFSSGSPIASALRP